jgi:hypothetical protein
MSRCYDTVTMRETNFCNTSIPGKISYFGIYILPSSVKNYDFIVIYIQRNYIIHEAYVLFQTSRSINRMLLLTLQVLSPSRFERGFIQFGYTLLENNNKFQLKF